MSPRFFDNFRMPILGKINYKFWPLLLVCRKLCYCLLFSCLAFFTGYTPVRVWCMIIDKPVKPIVLCRGWRVSQRVHEMCDVRWVCSSVVDLWRRLWLWRPIRWTRLLKFSENFKHTTLCQSANNCITWRWRVGSYECAELPTVWGYFASPGFICKAFRL